MTAICHNCGQEWPRHPCLEVICPLCGANVGARCRRPSGHSGPFVEFHLEREQAALDAGVLQMCPAGKASDVGLAAGSESFTLF